MFKLTCKSGPVVSIARLAALPVALLAFAAAAASAQTVPQLLPTTTKIVAGGGTSMPASGGKCPVSGFTATDAYGDGCLATEVLLGTGGATPGPRDAIADSLGNIFFDDYQNGVVHRIDAVTGILSDVAGGAASSPVSGTTGATCGGTSTDARGDGCNSTLVHLSHPTGLVFGPNGDLYIADYGYGEVRKVANTGGFIPAGGGTISLVAGGFSFGFNVSNATTTVTAAQSLLDGPYSLSFDSQGDLFIADEYEAAVVALNTTSAPTMVGASPTSNPISIAPGTIWKVAGTLSSGGPYCGSSGCTYNHVYTDGIQANTDYIRNAFGITVDPSGNLFITNEYYDTIQKVATTGILTTYAGTNNAPGHTLTRGQAGTIAIGSPFGVISDSVGNIYFDDAADGVIWRVDAGTLSQYVVATGFGFSNSGGFSSTSLPGPGIFGLSVDPYADLFYGDTENNVVGEVASGSQFGAVGANQPTNTLDIHFAKGDTPATTGAYTISAGANNFTTTGVATCTVNSDMTEDCLLPVTATPSVLGRFTGTLTVKSSLGAIANMPLSGYFVQSPVTRTSVTYTTAATCTGTTTYSTTTPVTFTGTLAANGPNPPGGSISFFANNGTSTITLGSANVTNIGTVSSPVYGAMLTYTFSTVGTYTITATYSGDSYFTTSTGKLANTITTAAPTYTLAPVAYQQNTVTAGQTALYSFTVAQAVYAGTISFAVTGLPANSTYSLSPNSIVAAGCSTTSTIALSIFTQQKTTVQPGSFAGGRGTWSMITAFAGMLLALAIGLRRRRIRFAQLWMVLALLLATSGMVACGKPVGSTLQPATPTGTYTITVTATGTTGTSPAPITFQLTVQ